MKAGVIKIQIEADTSALEASLDEIEGRLLGLAPDVTRAQAWGYRQIVKLILTGQADREPDGFLGRVKVISQQAAERGA